MIAHMEAVLNTGRLPTSLKELAIVRISQMNGCEYCLASHSLLAKKLGYSDTQIAALPHFEDSESFTRARRPHFGWRSVSPATSGPSMTQNWRIGRPISAKGRSSN
jgi:AhpD family alkylhydroperoxidase